MSIHEDQELQLAPTCGVFQLAIDLRVWGSQHKSHLSSEQPPLLHQGWMGNHRKVKFGDSQTASQNFTPKKHLQQFQIIFANHVLGFVSPFSHWHFTQVENQCYRVQPITIQPGRCVASTCEPLNACERTRLHDATTSGKKSCGPTVSFKDYRDSYWSMSQKYVWRLLVLDWLE